MARPRTFDEEEVILKARDVFWSHGYGATSLPDLLSATGLSRGSLYKAFDSKHGLFLRALDVYLDGGVANLQRMLDDAPTARDGVEAILGMIARMATRGDARCGCFAVNTSIELYPHDPEVRARLDAHNAAITQLYTDAFERAHDRGESFPGLPPERAARLIGVFVHGLQSRGRAGMTPEDVQTSVEDLLAALS